MLSGMGHPVYLKLAKLSRNLLMAQNQLLRIGWCPIRLQLKRQKVIALAKRFEKEHKAKQDQKAKHVMFDEGKEIGRRIANSNMSAKFAPSKNTVKRRLNTVAEEGLISPRRNPRVDYSKRPNYAEVDVDRVQRKRASADDYNGVDFDGPSKRARGKAAVEMLDNDSGGEDSGGEDIDATKVPCCCFYWCFYVVLLFFRMSH